MMLGRLAPETARSRVCVMQRKISSTVQKIRCQLMGPAIAGRLSAQSCTTDQSDLGVCVQSS